jgi:CysZ protein
MKVAASILGGLGDVFRGRLSWLAALNLAVAVTITAAAAWAAMRYLVPLIPEGAGWQAYLLNAGEVVAGIAVVVLALALSPAVSMAVGGALFDVAAARVEKAVGAPEGRLVPIHEGALNGLRIAGPALALNLLSLPLMFVPVVNLIWFLLLNGYLMGREYFSLAAVRRMSWAEARALRKRHAGAVFMVGLFAAVLPFVAPLFGAAAMTRLLASRKT